MNSDSITLSRLRFFGHHGVLPEETKHGQFLEVTIRLELPLAEAAHADDFARTVDYRAAHETVRAVMEGPPRKLAETLADQVAGALLQAFPAVQAVTVEVTKPHPPVNFAFAGFTATVHRRRV
jgi:dihydroneopterin aldolase